MISFIFSPQHTTGTPLSLTMATMLPQCSQIKNLCSIFSTPSLLCRTESPLRCPGVCKVAVLSVSAVIKVYHDFTGVKQKLTKQTEKALNAARTLAYQKRCLCRASTFANFCLPGNPSGFPTAFSFVHASWGTACPARSSAPPAKSRSTSVYARLMSCSASQGFP